MASPGQKRGSWGHIMAAFDSHDKCAQCREKGVGQFTWILNKHCKICDNLTDGWKDNACYPIPTRYVKIKNLRF